MTRGKLEIAALIATCGDIGEETPEALAGLRRLAENFRLVGLGRVTAVGLHTPLAAAEIEKAGARVVECAKGAGLLEKIQTALPAVADCRAFFLALSPRPVHPQTILSQITWWVNAGRKKKSRSVLVPIHDGVRGFPLLIGVGLMESLAQWPGPGGLEGWLAHLEEDETQEGARRTGGAAAFLHLPDPAVTENAPWSGNPWPPLKEAWQFLLTSGLKKDKLRHSSLAARGAMRLALAMTEAGYETDPKLCALAGVLHDVARREKKHARQGRLKAEAMGWPQIALVIGAHTDPPPPILRFIGHAPDRRDAAASSWGGKADQTAYEDITAPMRRACLAVYLADKYLWEDRAATIVDRFNASRRIFWSNRAALKTIARRERTALAVEAWLRDLLGRNPAEVVETPTANPWEEALSNLITIKEKRLREPYPRPAADRRREYIS